MPTIEPASRKAPFASWLHDPKTSHSAHARQPPAGKPPAGKPPAGPSPLSRLSLSHEQNVDKQAAADRTTPEVSCKQFHVSNDSADSLTQSVTVEHTEFGSAACFVPKGEQWEIQFRGRSENSLGRGPHRRPDRSKDPDRVASLPLFSPEASAALLADAKSIAKDQGVTDRGVRLPTDDVLVAKLPTASRLLVQQAIVETLVPFAKRHYPHLASKLAAHPIPPSGNLFIVRYSGAGRTGLKVHQDDTALTFNCCLSPQGGFTGGGTYFPASMAGVGSSQLARSGVGSCLKPSAPSSLGAVDGLLVKPPPGYCLLHPGNLRHAGSPITSGERFILVGFYGKPSFDADESLDCVQVNSPTILSFSKLLGFDPPSRSKDEIPPPARRGPHRRDSLHLGGSKCRYIERGKAQPQASSSESRSDPASKQAEAGRASAETISTAIHFDKRAWAPENNGLATVHVRVWEEPGVTELLVSKSTTTRGTLIAA